jgi:predicted nucleotidyltransferase
MRLTAEQVATIKRLVAEVYGPEAVVWLFGSQLDDRKKGGDIDLVVEVPTGASREIWSELRLQRALEEALNERKVDLVVHYRGDREGPFLRIAKREGVIL